MCNNSHRHNVSLERGGREGGGREGERERERRRDRILQVIADYLSTFCPPEHQILADLPGCDYTFPSSLASTDLQLDLVIWSETHKVTILAELTVCFETNFIDATERKSAKHIDLVEGCRSNGFIQISSC